MIFSSQHRWRRRRGLICGVSVDPFGGKHWRRRWWRRRRTESDSQRNDHVCERGGKRSWNQGKKYWYRVVFKRLAEDFSIKTAVKQLLYKQCERNILELPRLIKWYIYINMFYFKGCWCKVFISEKISNSNEECFTQKKGWIWRWIRSSRQKI